MELTNKRVYMITFLKKIELVPVHSRTAVEYDIKEMQKVLDMYRYNSSYYYISINLYKNTHGMLTLIGHEEIGRVSDVTPLLFKKANSIINKIIQIKNK